MPCGVPIESLIVEYNIRIRTGLHNVYLEGD